MNYFDLYSSYPDHTIAAAWDSQVKDADKHPWLADTLTECGDELFARFAACYAELRTLPRSARRALQRQLARSSDLATMLPEYLQQGGRRLQHRMAWSLAGAALLLALGQGVATAATITVTTNNPNIAPDGQCSLIEAIVNANNDAATFPDCAAGNGADTIVLPANANLMLSAVYSYGVYVGPVGLPPITSRITIEGNGATIARQGNAPAFGLIWVKGNNSVAGAPPTPGDLTLQYVTLSGGSALVGGLLNAHGGNVAIKNSIISGNGLPASIGFGVTNGGTLTIENSVISSNGNGVDNGGTLTIERSTISGNDGGSASRSVGLLNFADLAIENSTISGNAGQGVTNLYGNLTIQSSTISANQGGGVGNIGGRVAIANSTISGNVSQYGGGVLNEQYCYRSYPCVPATLTLNNSLIAGNQATVGPEIENDASSSVSANNFNLFGTNGNAGVSGFTPGPTDIVPSVPLANILGPLQNNGGPTETHALVAGSPAIDAGNPNGCLPTDQRGFLRPADGNNDGTSGCDIGAYEANAIISNYAAFVLQEYIDFLDRGPGTGEVSAWVNALDNGLAKADLIEAFMDSEEFFFRGKFIAKTYLGLLTRDADYAGFRSWLGALLGGLSREQIVQAFWDSGEFQSRFGSNLTNGQFVQRMYNNILLRSTDPGELNVWVGALNNGQLTKAQVVLILLDSAEFQGLFVSQNRVDISLLYFDMLQRDPDPGSFSAWVGVLNSGASLTAVIDGFLNSSEYQAGF